jgi:chromosome partitioning protein
MALTIAVAGLKGGIGKSTITLNLATCLHRAGHKVLIVDADPQGTCRTWSAKAAEAGHDGPPVVAIEGKTLRKDLARVAEGFDVVVIDSPPRMGTESRAAMLVADLVVLPTVPGAADTWALTETLVVLEDARGIRPELRAVVVLNRTDRTTLARLTREAVETLGATVLDEGLGARVAFGEAMLAGLGVVDYSPDSDAALEVRRLTKAALAAMTEGSTTS